MFMKNPFMPDLIKETIYDIDFDELLSTGTKLIIFDIDNTLAPYEMPEPDSKLHDFFEMLKHKGFIFAFASNNNGDRVEIFNNELGAYYISNAKKPFTKAFRQILEKYNEAPQEAVGIGDQIFTDICAANLCGMKSIMVFPIKDKTTLFFRFKRFMEKPFIWHYNKTKGVKK